MGGSASGGEVAPPLPVVEQKQMQSEFGVGMTFGHPPLGRQPQPGPKLRRVPLDEPVFWADAD